MNFKVAYFCLISIVVISCSKDTSIIERFPCHLSFEIENKGFIELKGNELNDNSWNDSLYFISSRISSFNDTTLGDDSLNLNYNMALTSLKDSELSGFNLVFKKAEDSSKVFLDSNFYNYKKFEFFKNSFNLGNQNLIFDVFEDYGIYIDMNYKNQTYSSKKMVGNNQDISVHSNFYNSLFEIIDIENYYSSITKKHGLRLHVSFKMTLYNEQEDSIRLNNGSAAIILYND